MTTATRRASSPGWAAAATPQQGSSRWWLGAVNLVGGVAVLGSYAHGISTDRELATAAWGGVPDALRGLYVASMGVAAAGYLAMAHYAFFALARHGARVGRLDASRVMTALYAAILVPSALWMPLTYRLLEAPTAFQWWIVRVDLALVAIASLALVAVVGAAEPRGGRRHRLLALAGGLAFCWQTVVLDGLVWTSTFPI